jgi:hypothetical protein
MRPGKLTNVQQDSIPIEMQMKGLGQKYMGGRPESHAQAMFSEQSVHADKNHPVPISNFMNAQCTHFLPSYSGGLTCCSWTRTLIRARFNRLL